jgi:bifunctional non-homologous end joining protein LigD
MTNPDRVLYEEQGITKRDLAEYYAQVADWMLPHVAGRPLALVRCPSGMAGECFYQKHPPQGLPEAVGRIPVREKDEVATYLVIDDLQGLVSLVQFGALEIHVRGSRGDDLERPDRMVFDLDPDPAVPWKKVVDAAFLLRDTLAELGLVSFVKTTGGKGLHVVAPLARRQNWEEVKRFSKAVAELLTSVAPDRFVANMSKQARRGKIFVDYLRNDHGATAVVAYSTRAHHDAPVSMPVAWDELRSLSGPREFTVENVPQRLARQRRDPWRDLSRVRQSITAASKRKLGLR